MRGADGVVGFAKRADTVESMQRLTNMGGTYPKSHAHMLTKVPKIPPKYPKSHAQMLLMKVPKMLPKYPKCIGLSLLHG